jgi:hypothetical protein
VRKEPKVKRLVVIIICAVIAGKIFASVVVRFAEKSDLTSKTFVHRLLLNRGNPDDQMNVSNIPNNLAIAKTIPRSYYNHQNFPIVVNTKPAVVAKTVGKTDEKAVEEKAKADEAKAEDERRKARRKALEEKTNAVADKAQSAPAPYVPPLVDNTYPTYYAYQPPMAQSSPAPNTTSTAAPATSVTKTSGGSGVSTLSNSNVASWISILTTNPTASLMATFENSYNSKQITETEFYSVLTAMQASSNTEARNFSVQAAGLYQNIYSFKILSDEGQGDSNQQIKALAQSELAAYAVAADASILQQALASGDPNEVLEAKTLLGGTTGTAPANASAVARN